MDKNIYLTFDMDWVNDGVLEYFYEMICELDICGTLFVTHDTSFLDMARQGDRLELGIHPNFNRLMENTEPKNVNAETIIRDLLKVVPEAVSVRSHALVRSSLLSRSFSKNGLKYESNIFYSVEDGITIKKYQDVWGMMQIPIIFEDDIYLLSEGKHSMEWYINGNFTSPMVFNFHPLHLYVNSDKMEQYDNAKKYIHNYEMLKPFRNSERWGTEKNFRELVSIAKKNNYSFRKIKEIH